MEMLAETDNLEIVTALRETACGSAV